MYTENSYQKVEDSILSIINKSIKSCKFPKEMKQTEIFPEHKSGPKDSKENFRPVNHENEIAKISE